MDTLERFKVTALMIVIIFGSIFLLRLQAGITGSAITGATVLTHVQGANFDVDANAGASLTLVNFPEGSTLTFFRAAGLLEGDGTAKIYLVADDRTKYLVADEGTILASARNLVTGYAVKEDKAEQSSANSAAQNKGNQGGGNNGNNGNGQGNGNGGGQGNNQGQGNSDNENKQNEGEERWHHTPKPNPRASFYTAVDNKKEAEKQRQKYNFELACSDSCELPAGKFASKEVKLLFEVSNARLKINNVQYGFAPYAVAPPEPEVPPATNTTPPEINITLPPEPAPVTNITNETQTPAAETQSGGGNSPVTFSSGSLVSSSPLTAAAVASPVELGTTSSGQPLGQQEQNTEGQELEAPQTGESTVTVRQRAAASEQSTGLLTGAIPITLEQVDRQSAMMMLVDVMIGSLIIWQFMKGVGWQKLKRKLRLR